MSLGILEYAKLHPTQEPEQERQAAKETARSYREQLDAAEEAEDLKRSIAQQIEQGNAPELILYTAIRTIGVLTNDEDWAGEQRDRLNGIYADLAQQSLIIDNAALAAARLEEQKKGYVHRTQKQLQRSLTGCGKLTRLLTEALQELEQLHPEEENAGG